jgi:hypothetical protein
MRHHMTVDGPVPFTPEEEAEWDAREAEELAAAPSRQWNVIRAERDAKLAACDWTQVADAPVDAATWSAYRQALRDLPQAQTDPFNIVWPTPPAA